MDLHYLTRSQLKNEIARCRYNMKVIALISIVIGFLIGKFS